MAAPAPKAIDDAGESDQEVENITPDLGHGQTFAIGGLDHQLIGHYLEV